MTDPVARAVAFYLPQYYPIELNDRVYGPGHTEWTNVKAARPLFPGHRQPVLPGELGFYDLRDPDVRLAQAQLAQTYGISAFCYWTYWSDGERIMERPLDEVVRSGEPRFPFCLAWANHPWHDITGRISGYIFTQRYCGQRDYAAFFRAMEPILHDERYLKVHGKCLFYIFRPFDIPDIQLFTDTWHQLAEESGLGGLYFIGQSRGLWDGPNISMVSSALDAMVEARVHPPYSTRPLWTRSVDRLRRGPIRFLYSDLTLVPLPMVIGARQSFPCVITNWDNTPRWGRNGVVLRQAKPSILEHLMREARRIVADRDVEEKIIFLKSWNEWAEGNYLEPDQESGRSRLEAVAASLRP